MNAPQPMRIEANRRVVELADNSHAEVARILGYTDRRNVWPWTNDLKPFPPHHCHALEIHFGGRITRQELRPHDWQKHWPDLAPAFSGAK
jgi:DNA-binding transcriptional regulator YdaS (Cro superfamily)